MTSGTPPRALRTERERWERLARDPYYAVLNVEQHRDARMTEEDRACFARSGEDDMARTVDEIRRWVVADFAPRRAVDFGCGVGRLTIPIARLSGHVTGIDISDAMLAEARRNCAANGVANVDFVTSDAYFAGGVDAEAPIDFVHAYIVFQHMVPAAGLWVADALVRRLAPGGVGALHFTYARRASRLRRVVHRLRRVVPGVNALVNLVQRRALSEPLIPMNEYDLGDLFMRLSDHGCTHVHARLTDHGGHLGAMLLFRRP
jgi:2-polyprenyl-3-methyl-5-hydroxy-6-metoxy-1,4-benzoquinol methylase